MDEQDRQDKNEISADAYKAEGGVYFYPVFYTYHEE